MRQECPLSPFHSLCRNIGTHNKKSGRHKRDQDFKHRLSLPNLQFADDTTLFFLQISYLYRTHSPYSTYSKNVGKLSGKCLSIVNEWKMKAVWLGKYKIAKLNLSILTGLVIKSDFLEPTTHRKKDKND